MTESLTFGRWMKRQRTELDLTQEALAEQVGCAPQTIRTYESGTRRPSRELAERLADVLQVPVDQRVDFLHLARATAGPARARPPVADGAAVQPFHETPILTTKLYVPQLREDVIPRERLLDALGEALNSRQLVLLSAPAGSGKTTLLVTALQTLPDLPVAWLALDEEDNDLIRFLTAIAAALQQIDPAFGATLQALLSAGGLGDYRDSGAQARRLIGGLINEIVQRLPERFVLALDDLHRVTEPVVHLALDYLLERLPPQMTVALTTRYDPPLALARLRASRQLAEIRLEDLRFTLDETAMLLNDRFQLQLSPGDLQALQARTDGWAAGLSLLVASLERVATPGDRTQFITHLAQSDHYIFEYLAEEVLNRQEPPIRTLLLQTAVLHELTPVACQAVTGRGDAGALLEELYRRNLFLVAMERGGSTVVYRYHDLFAQFLRVRLTWDLPEQVRDLHRRAAEAQAVPERAIAHYLAGEWWDEAARQIMQVGEQILQQGAVRRLRSWIEALPVEVRQRQPRLGYWLGVSMWAMGQFDAAHGLLEEASEAFAAAGDGAGQSEALVFLADCRTWMVDFTGAREATEKALRCPISPHMEVQLRCVRARSAFFQGDAPAVIANLEAAITVVETTRDERAVHELACGYTPDFAVLPGGMQRSERFCRLVTAHLGQTISPLHATVALHNSFAFLWRGMWEEALREGERALAISDQFGGLFWVDAEIERMLPICHVLRGDEQSAERAFDTLFHHLEQPAMAAYARPAMASYLYLVGRVRWLQGRLDAAREIYARMRAAEYPHECVFAPYFRTLMRGLLEMNDAQYPNAECSFREAVALQSRQPFTVALSNARLLLAYLYYRWGREEEALAELAPLLEEREQQNAPGFIMWEAAPVVVPLLQLAVQRGVHPEFAAHVLELLGANAEAAQDSQAASLVDTAEALTPREVEVLRLLAQGYSNQAIAHDLVVAVGTVKRHVNSIMSKLHVESRLQAVARARDLDLV